MSQGERIAYESCPLCESRNAGAFRHADASGHPRFKPGIPSRMTWMRCGDCGHGYTDGYFAAPELALLFSESNPGQIVGERFEASREISARMIDKVSRYVREGAWLDVGFGNGSLLFTAQEYGFEPVGLDLRRQNAEQLAALGIEAHCRDVAEIDQPGRFSVVSMADVLEHMPFPKGGLTAAYRLLRKGGILFVSMPNADAPAWRLLGDANPYWAEIEHYHNFGRERLYALLSEFGFDPVAYGISQRYRLCMEVIAVRT